MRRHGSPSEAILFVVYYGMGGCTLAKGVATEGQVNLYTVHKMCRYTWKNVGIQGSIRNQSPVMLPIVEDKIQELELIN